MSETCYVCEGQGAGWNEIQLLGQRLVCSECLDSWATAWLQIDEAKSASTYGVIARREAAGLTSSLEARHIGERLTVRAQTTLQAWEEWKRARRAEVRLR